MWAKPSSPAACAAVLKAITDWLELSRFRAKVGIETHSRWGQVVKISFVRRRKKGHYCGQHPGPCQGIGGQRHSGSCLQGADWVAFNDGLNDALDALSLAADVWSFNREASSGRFFIRKGASRRVTYCSHERKSWGRTFHVWDMDGDFEDYTGMAAPRSVFPPDTPGNPDWRREP